jgi:hypothetical protein
MNIELGWCLLSADFSMQAMEKRKTGTVTFIRDEEGRKKWHSLSDEIKDSEGCPQLYVCASGETIEDAIINANLMASRSLMPNVKLRGE